MRFDCTMQVLVFVRLIYEYLTSLMRIFIRKLTVSTTILNTKGISCIGSDRVFTKVSKSFCIDSSELWFRVICPWIVNSVPTIWAEWISIKFYIKKKTCKKKPITLLWKEIYYTTAKETLQHHCSQVIKLNQKMYPANVIFFLLAEHPQSIFSNVFQQTCQCFSFVMKVSHCSNFSLDLSAWISVTETFNQYSNFYFLNV